jgi:hypothetical protein
VLLPVFNVSHYDVEYDGRYVLPLLPMIHAAIGVTIVDGWRWLRARLALPLARTALTLGLAVVVLVLAAVPLAYLGRYYERASRSEPTNASLVRAMDGAKAALKDEASTIRVMKYILEFDQIPFETAYIDADVLERYRALGKPMVVVLSSGFDSKETARLGELIDRFGMTGVDGRPARPPRPADRYGVYRFDPALVGRR